LSSISQWRRRRRRRRVSNFPLVDGTSSSLLAGRPSPKIKWGKMSRTERKKMADMPTGILDVTTGSTFRGTNKYFQLDVALQTSSPKERKVEGKKNSPATLSPVCCI
jgi:hypothetical protein